MHETPPRPVFASSLKEERPHAAKVDAASRKKEKEKEIPFILAYVTARDRGILLCGGVPPFDSLIVFQKKVTHTKIQHLWSLQSARAQQFSYTLRRANFARRPSTPARSMYLSKTSRCRTTIHTYTTVRVSALSSFA